MKSQVLWSHPHKGSSNRWIREEACSASFQENSYRSERHNFVLLRYVEVTAALVVASVSQDNIWLCKEAKLVKVVSVTDQIFLQNQASFQFCQTGSRSSITASCGSECNHSSEKCVATH